MWTLYFNGSQSCYKILDFWHSCSCLWTKKQVLLVICSNDKLWISATPVSSLSSCPLCPMGGIGQPYSCLPHLSVLSHNFGLAPTEVGSHQIFLDASMPGNSRSGMFPCTLWVPIHLCRKKCMFVSPCLSAWPLTGSHPCIVHVDLCWWSLWANITSEFSILRHSPIEVCTFFADIVVTLHICELYNKTAFMLVLKILILAAIHWALLLWTKLSTGKARCAFFLQAIMPPSVPLVFKLFNVWLIKTNLLLNESIDHFGFARVDFKACSYCSGIQSLHLVVDILEPVWKVWWPHG